MRNFFNVGSRVLSVVSEGEYVVFCSKHNKAFQSVMEYRFDGNKDVVLTVGSYIGGVVATMLDKKTGCEIGDISKVVNVPDGSIVGCVDAATVNLNELVMYLGSMRPDWKDIARNRKGLGVSRIYKS